MLRLSLIGAKLNSDIVYIAKGGFWLSVEQMATNITSLALVILFARYLNRTTYGNYNYIHSILGILTIVSLPGLDSVVSQAVAKGYGKTILPALRAKIQWGLIASIVAGLIATYYYARHNPEFGTTFILISLFFPIMMSTYLYDAYLMGKGLFKTAAIFESVYQLINTLVLCATVLISSSLTMIFLVFLFTTACTRLIFYKRTLQRYPPNSKIDPKAVNYGMHVSFTSAFGALASYIDKVLVFYFLGPVNLAVYSFATLPIDKGITLLESVFAVALPKFSSASLQKIDNVLFNKMLQLSGIGIVLSFLYFLTAPLIFKTIFPKYLDSVPLSQLFAVILIFKLPTLLLGYLGQAKVTLFPKRFLYYSSIIPQLLFILSLIVFGKFFGMYGIVVSRVVFSLLLLAVGLFNWHVLKSLYPATTI